MQVNFSTVLGITGAIRPVFFKGGGNTGDINKGAGGAIGLERSTTGPHDGGVNRHKQIARSTGRQVVDQLDPHRPILLGNDDRPQKMESRRWGNRIVCDRTGVCQV